MTVINPSIINRKLLSRIFSKIKISTEHFYKGEPCWEWTGCIARTSGYARIMMTDKVFNGHQVFCGLFNGQVPPGFEVDHLCRVRQCVNPTHLEAVTPEVNRLRGACASTLNAQKTHCQFGHPFTQDNIYWSKTGARNCKICHKRYARNKHQQIQALPINHPIRSAYRQRRTENMRRRRARS